MKFIKNVGIGIVCAGLLGTGAQAAGYVKFASQDSKVFKVEKGEKRTFDKSSPKLKERSLREIEKSPRKAIAMPKAPTRRMDGPQIAPPTPTNRKISPQPDGRALGNPLPRPPAAVSLPAAARRTAIATGGCVDPTAQSISISGVRDNGDGTYDFSLRGTVVNRGSSQWVSGDNQQIANLSQGGTTKAVARFPRLDAGARVNTAFARIQRWLPSQEFQQGFELRISYDPDIFIDGNDRNDDCQMGNNVTAISVAEINREIARQAH
ncbi:MAG: hypothetical protein CL910_02590 [Deltaproteobacteria bacterium]|nr:hypothetical protein [Deltaproteobacteria bacterium]